jgi:hypothetical protein
MGTGCDPIGSLQEVYWRGGLCVWIEKRERKSLL